MSIFSSHSGGAATVQVEYDGRKAISQTAAAVASPHPTSTSGGPARSAPQAAGSWFAPSPSASPWPPSPRPCPPSWMLGLQWARARDQGLASPSRCVHWARHHLRPPSPCQEGALGRRPAAPKSRSNLDVTVQHKRSATGPHLPALLAAVLRPGGRGRRVSRCHIRSLLLVRLQDGCWHAGQELIHRGTAGRWWCTLAFCTLARGGGGGGGRGGRRRVVVQSQHFQTRRPA